MTAGRTARWLHRGSVRHGEAWGPSKGRAGGASSGRGRHERARAQPTICVSKGEKIGVGSSYILDGPASFDSWMHQWFNDISRGLKPGRHRS